MIIAAGTLSLLLLSVCFDLKNDHQIKLQSVSKALIIILKKKDSELILYKKNLFTNSSKRTKLLKVDKDFYGRDIY